MSEKNLQQIETFDSSRWSVRIVLILAVLGAIALGWFSIRWQLGNMLAELTLPTEPNAKQVSAAALDLSPGDPMANWLAASVEKDVFTPENLANSLEGYKRTVQISPNDFRWWIELGRAYEQNGDATNAEKSFLRSVEIAPNYTYPHWQLGNFYLRQGRDSEAFDELKKAAENNVIYREQVFSIAWDFFEQDTARLEQLAGNSPATRAGLARFYAVKERAEDSLRIWNTLSGEEKEAHQDVAKIIAQALYDKRFFRSAVQFIQQLGIEPEAKFETVQNASFESAIGAPGEVYFGWKVLPVEKMEIKLDPMNKHEGNRSLRVALNGYAGVELNNIYQYIAVDASTKYRLTFWLKTDNLKSAGTPTLEVINANDDKIIATTKAFPTGTNDWQQVQLDFTTAANTQAISLRTARSYCGNACPIVGTFWYDDFKIEKVK